MTYTHTNTHRHIFRENRIVCKHCTTDNQRQHQQMSDLVDEYLSTVVRICVPYSINSSWQTNTLNILYIQHTAHSAHRETNKHKWKRWIWLCHTLCCTVTLWTMHTRWEEKTYYTKQIIEHIREHMRLCSSVAWHTSKQASKHTEHDSTFVFHLEKIIIK